MSPRAKQLVYRRDRGACWYADWFDPVTQSWKRKSTGISAEASRKRAAEKVAAQWRQEGEDILSGATTVASLYASLSIEQHLAAFLAARTAKARAPSKQHLDETESKLRRVFAAAGWKRLDQMTSDGFLAAIERISGDKRKAKTRRASAHELSSATKNRFRAAVQAFSRWAHQTGRLESHRMAAVEAWIEEGEATFTRWPLDLAEIGRLCTATWTAPPAFGLTGQERAYLYLIAIATGLRADELRFLRPSQIRREGDQLYVALRARETKNRRGGLVALSLGHAELQADVELWIAERQASGAERLFPTVPRSTALMLRADLERAGVPTSHPEYGLRDFHTLRTTTATSLSRAGVPIEVAQKQMRHSSMDLTNRRYNLRSVGEIGAETSRALRNVCTGFLPLRSRHAEPDSARWAAQGDPEMRDTPETQDPVLAGACALESVIAHGWDGIEAERPERDLNPRITDLQSARPLAATDCQSVIGDAVAREPDRGVAARVPEICHYVGDAPPPPPSAALAAARDARARSELGARPDLALAFRRIGDLASLARTEPTS